MLLTETFDKPMKITALIVIYFNLTDSKTVEKLTGKVVSSRL